MSKALTDLLAKPQVFGGVQIIVRDDMTDTVPRFPYKKWTKRRRRRVIGKFGSWTWEKPAAYRVGPAIICHPKIHAELKRHSKGSSQCLM